MTIRKKIKKAAKKQIRSTKKKAGKIAAKTNERILRELAKAKNQYKKAEASVKKYAKNNPRKALGIATAVGAAVGTAIGLAVKRKK